MLLFVLLIIFFLIFLWALSIMFFMRRAVALVTNIFREQKALGMENAKTSEELGIVQHRGLVERMVKSPDYKPYALQFLTRMGVVKEAGDSYLYFSEEKLTSLHQEKSMNEESRWKMWKLLLPPKS